MRKDKLILIIQTLQLQENIQEMITFSFYDMELPVSSRNLVTASGENSLRPREKY